MQLATAWFAVMPSPCGYERVDDDLRPHRQWCRRMTGKHMPRRHGEQVKVFWRDKEYDSAVLDWLRAQAGFQPIELVRPQGPGQAGQATGAEPRGGEAT